MGSQISTFWDDNKDGVLDFFLRLLIALVVLFIGIKIIKFITSLVHRALSANKKLDPTIAGFFESIVRFALRFILLIIVFDQLGIENTSFIAIAGAAVFAIAFALQGAMANFAAGVMLLTFRPFKVGDLVSCAGEHGFVRRIELFTTQIVTTDGKLVICPNGSITSDNITNYHSLDKMRLEISIGITYGDDVHMARKVALDVMNNNPIVLDEPQPSFVMVGLGDNSVNFEARPWVRPEHYHRGMVQVLEELKIAFDVAGLEFPFPQRDVHLNLVDTPDGPPSYDWTDIKDLPGGADALFKRMKRQETNVNKLLQLSPEEEARQAQVDAEEEAKRAAEEAKEDAEEEAEAEEKRAELGKELEVARSQVGLMDNEDYDDDDEEPSKAIGI